MHPVDGYSFYAQLEGEKQNTSQGVMELCMDCNSTPAEGIFGAFCSASYLPNRFLHPQRKDGRRKPNLVTRSTYHC